MKFEYKYVHLYDVYKANDERGVTEYLNKLGNEGWELVSFISESGPRFQFIFKRQK